MNKDEKNNQSQIKEENNHDDKINKCGCDASRNNLKRDEMINHEKETSQKEFINNDQTKYVANQKQEVKKNFYNQPTSCNCHSDSVKSTEAHKNEQENSCDKIQKLAEENVHLKTDLHKIKQELINAKLRYQADLDNFTKRIQKEKNIELKYASMELVRDILIPLELFERTLETPYEDKILKQFLLGFQMINQQIKDILIQYGVKEIKSLGEKFNPQLHHALEKISDPQQPNGINVVVLQKGFLYKDLVVMPSKVKVNEWSNTNNEENK
ncbi:nucleotide exchange factor GrpE [Candidatus Phytoplasma melaleucae]|uniref:Protein GrpE n=1 Tax=Candidatus Phytoplasma melaleucae TaxID=2982630 RepID=A0ABT9DCT5_9MOLU|nr:nucleotide exchange factor GrpE ['Melaleuca sp.' phytoplasma]MDO8167912.1 nucleotide exchange factor GrpE ['Melaleuca sp.' phytoplasma]